MREYNRTERPFLAVKLQTIVSIYLRLQKLGHLLRTASNGGLYL